jgi:TPP-dependent indolepyruvate ferredoxin oxidoreductase alpha subunit|tara:strand:+ start:43 stop:546 length:504 start_codon:yes stop_codon:yes gene_type:complete
MNFTNVKDITVEETRAQIACMLNELWHSRLPKIHWSNVVRNTHYVCYVFKFKQAIIGVGIWSSPVAQNRFKDGKKMLELRRLALCDVCPKNTATYVISQMIKQIKIKFSEINRLISYQDTTVHLGTIYKAANWTVVSNVPLMDWSNKQRKRNVLQSDSSKVRWEYKI